MASLPSLESILSTTTYSPDPNSPLAATLSALYEPSEVLISSLVPQVYGILKSQSGRERSGSDDASSTLDATGITITSYTELIDLSMSVVRSWDVDLRAAFIKGHPRIGETRKEVLAKSKFSSREQGIEGDLSESKSAAPPTTPPAVLARLSHLNTFYEHRYPGLVYIVFVNGRSREEIVRVLEGHLGLAHVYLELAELESINGDDELDNVSPVQRGSKEWIEELDRAVKDIGLIAKSRVRNLGYS
ncbi:hypothetical protein GYMLUDRAFT_47943 [Collybiopsis luxurians FD-317 M1]|uniref:Oxo-4-hydroxy-4-carboxy-5-ureidoimidazoline decarboxylase domain-containing protein n=1 Tax=Collybiopsis luxurians FD-317 M1 TaxID=944289 RepID=A0A0D0BKW2_9AGAR|nr:hypothetical protein GYMLUDRAFT_47943 [Collybiopsis luxurians FD-317 M1]